MTRNETKLTSEQVDDAYKKINPGKFHDVMWEYFKDEKHADARRKLSMCNLRGIIQDAYAAAYLSLIDPEVRS